MKFFKDAYLIFKQKICNVIMQYLIHISTLDERAGRLKKFCDLWQGLIQAKNINVRLLLHDKTLKNLKIFKDLI